MSMNGEKAAPPKGANLEVLLRGIRSGAWSSLVLDLTANIDQHAGAILSAWRSAATPNEKRRILGALRLCDLRTAISKPDLQAILQTNPEWARHVTADEFLTHFGGVDAVVKIPAAAQRAVIRNLGMADTANIRHTKTAEAAEIIALLEPELAPMVPAHLLSRDSRARVYNETGYFPRKLLTQDHIDEVVQLAQTSPRGVNGRLSASLWRAVGRETDDRGNEIFGEEQFIEIHRAALSNQPATAAEWAPSARKVLAKQAVQVEPRLIFDMMQFAGAQEEQDNWLSSAITRDAGRGKSPLLPPVLSQMHRLPDAHRYIDMVEGAIKKDQRRLEELPKAYLQLLHIQDKSQTERKSRAIRNH